MRVPSQAKPGRHEIRVTWDYPPKKVPERVFTLDVVNPDWGNTPVDPDVEDFKKKFPGATVAILQQGWPCEAVKSKEFVGCEDASIGSDHFNNGKSRMLKVGKYSVSFVTLIRFDLSGLPKGTTVEAALLKLRSMQCVQPAPVAHRLLRPWSAGNGFNGDVRPGLMIESLTGGGGSPKEGEASWLYSRKPEKWAAAGASAAGQDREAEPLSGREILDAVPAPAPNERRGWVAWDMTKAVKDWVAKPEANFGVVIDRSSYCVFSSSESIDPQCRPKLILVLKKP